MRSRAIALAALALCLAGCVAPIAPPSDPPTATPPAPFADPCPVQGFAAARAVPFVGADDTPLVGQLDLPAGASPFPAVAILHHAGAVDRCAYDYMARLLVQSGLAVFRFDKRGTGASGGVYGCCEDEDAVRAWAQAAALPEIDPKRLFLIAQSRGTQIAADHMERIVAAQRPRGIVLLSSLLDAKRIVALPGPLLLIVSDSEGELARIGPEAADAYRATGQEIELLIAEGTEHTLFDITQGPIDWEDPAWRTRFHAESAELLTSWLKDQADFSDQ